MMLTKAGTRGLVRLLAMLVLLGMLCWDAHADDGVIDVGQPQAQPEFISLASHFAVLEDASRNLSLADVRRPETAVRFRQDAQRQTDLNYGNTHSAIWLRLQLKNSSEHPVERLLELAYAAYVNVQFYAPAADGGYTTVTTGRVFPFVSRPYPNRYFVFPLSVPAHTEQTLYLRVNSIAVPLPAKLWEPAAFYRHERNDYTGQAMYFGVAAAMFLFNLFLFAVLRERMYLWYLAALTCMALTMAEMSGLAKEFLWPNSPNWSLMAINIGYVLTMATVMTFMCRMLDTVVNAPRLDRVLRLLSGLLVFSVFGLVLNSERFAPWITWLGLVVIIAVLGCGIYCAFLRLRSAYFFVTAFSLMLVSGLMWIMRNLALLPGSALLSQAPQIGSALEMIVLALALADRFFQIRLQNIRVEKAALAAQTQLVEVLQSSERQLEQRVIERTSELSTALNKLQTAQALLVDSEQRATMGQQKALDTLAAQQQFIAMVSHEFRSPLAVIDNSAQMLANQLVVQTESKAATLVARIRRGTVRLAQFLDTCMTQDRLRDAGLLLKPAALDLAALADAASDGAQLLAEQHRIVTKVQPDLPPMQGDAELLRILLANLLSNAIKYSAPGSEIRLRVRHVRDRHIFEVIDQGCGIPADEIPHLFQKYRRGRLALTKPGAGLGLALCWQIVQLHGGHIHVDSTQGVGTRVVVEFPSESSAEAHISQFD